MFKKTMLLICLVLGLSTLGFAATAGAYSITNQENDYMGPDQIVDGPMYTTGEMVRVTGTVNGDLYCAGQTVEVTGTVNGDVLCAAQQLTISGKVTGDVRAGAQILNIEGPVGGSLTGFAQTLRLSADGSIGRDATILAQSTTIDGKIARDLVGAGAVMNINSAVGGSAKLKVQSLTLGSKANIAGTVSYTSAKDATLNQGSKVGGITRTEPEKPSVNMDTTPLAAKLAGGLYWFAAMFVVGLAILFILPRSLDLTAEQTASKPWAVFSWGLVSLIVAPILALLLVFTIIGIPLMLILILAWILLLSVSTVFSGHALGRLIIQQGKTKLTAGRLRLASLALGLFVLGIGYLLPIIGTITGLLAVTFGVGSMLYVLRNKRGADSQAPKRSKA
jgi:cytoskeletal protein CcmA (bactofilin family)